MCIGRESCFKHILHWRHLPFLDILYARHLDFLHILYLRHLPFVDILHSRDLDFLYTLSWKYECRSSFLYALFSLQCIQCIFERSSCERECVLEAFYYDRQCVLYQTVFFIQVGLKRWYLVLYAVCG